MHTGASPRVAQALTLCLAAATAGNGWARGVQATQVDAKAIRMTTPGRFETSFTLQKGFGGHWFDLVHDPEKRRDLAPT